MEGSMLRTASRIVLAAGAVAAGAAAAMVLRADLMIGYGFSRAFEARMGAPTFQVAAPTTGARGSSARAEVGDEAYWLSRGGTVAAPVMLGRRLVVGDRIVVSSEYGKQQLEVVAIKFVGAPIHNVADGLAPVWLVRVTFRVVGPNGAAPGGDDDGLVHLWFQVDATKPDGLRSQEGELGRT
jgi:hypothetical protein